MYYKNEKFYIKETPEEIDELLKWFEEEEESQDRPDRNENDNQVIFSVLENYMLIQSFRYA